MSKRLIGIEIGASSLHIAILNHEKGQIAVKALVKRNFFDSAELVSHLNEALTGEFSYGDQLATNLATRSAYVRNLRFPFQSEGKVSAAIPFELSAQLPVAIENCVTASQKAQKVDDGVSVVAAAVSKETVESSLGVFEAASVPIHCIDLAPFCYAACLGEQIGNGVLVCASDQETTAAVLRNGLIVDYRVLPALSVSDDEPAGLLSLIREIKVLGHLCKEESLATFLMGSVNLRGIASALEGEGLKVNLLSLELEDQFVDTEFIPAASLAMRAQISRPNGSFNFRQGEYQLKGEWASFKKKLALLGAILSLGVLVFASSMIVKYVDKSNRAEKLQKEMVGIYREVFPNAKTIIDVPLQLKSAIKELESKGGLDSGDVSLPLNVLKEISSLPDEYTVEFQEYAMGTDDLKLTGYSVDFESVNQMAKRLESSPLFSQAQVTNAQLSLSGERINFSLLLSIAGKAGEK